MELCVALLLLLQGIGRLGEAPRVRHAEANWLGVAGRWFTARLGSLVRSLG